MYGAHRGPFDSGCIAFVGDLREVPRWFIGCLKRFEAISQRFVLEYILHTLLVPSVLRRRCYKPLKSRLSQCLNFRWFTPSQSDLDYLKRCHHF
jgi:hypothetical protein